MSDISAKPYFIRALWEWCNDQNLTPYLVVRPNSKTRVPPGLVKNGEIVLSISASATNHLKIDNDGLSFSARFSGVSKELLIPIDAVAGIFARENGYGMGFEVMPEAAPSPSIDSDEDIESTPEPSQQPVASKPKGRKPTASKLRLVK